MRYSNLSPIAILTRAPIFSSIAADIVHSGDANRIVLVGATTDLGAW